MYLPPEFPRDGPRILLRHPPDVFHPNIRYPFLCLNKWIPSMHLEELCWRIGSLLSYKSYTMDERVSLDPAACAYARSHQELFPIDPRPFVPPADIEVV